MRNRILSLSVLAVAILFSSALFTTSANARDDYHKYKKDYRQSYHVKPDYRSSRGDRFEHHRSNSGNRYGNYNSKYGRDYRNDYRKDYKKHDRNDHYKKHWKKDHKHDYRYNKYDRHDHRHHSKHRYKKDDPQFIFSLVLPLISSFSAGYGEY